MSTSILTAKSPKEETPKTSQEVAVATENQLPPLPIMVNGGLTLTVIGLIIYGKIQIKAVEKNLRLENFCTREVEQKWNLPRQTIRKMESNPH